MPENDCLFCKVVSGEVPADVVHHGETVVAFRDINPQAPTHVLVVPRDHHPDVGALAAGRSPALADLALAAKAIARAEGHDDFRLVFNTGPARASRCSTSTVMCWPGAT